MTFTIDTFGGNCPVQGYGTVEHDGVTRDWYFRARGQHWSVTVGTGDGDYVRPNGSDIHVGGPCDDVRPYSAGYMETDECERHLAGALTRWANGERGMVELPDPPDLLPPCANCGVATANRVGSIAVCEEHAPKWEAVFGKAAP